MGDQKLHPLIREAMNLAQMAGWGVRIKNDVVQINVPGKDGEGKSYRPLVVDLDPNEPTLDKWRATARLFNLMGDGPASTPQERAAADAAKTAEKAKGKELDRSALQKKEAEIKAAAEKAAAATAAGRAPDAGRLVQPPTGRPLFVAPTDAVPTPKPTPLVPASKETPVQKPAPVGSGFPKFEDWMLTASASKLKLTEGPSVGLYLCPECLQDSVETALKLPQGLASHRGFRHSRFANTQTATEGSNIMAAALPPNLRDAFDLLAGEIAETMAKLEGTDTAAKDQEIKDLKAKLDKAQSDLVRVGKDYTAANTLAAERAKALTALQGTLDSTVKANKASEDTKLQSFERLLRQMRTLAQTLSPVQAVGKIDEMIGQYVD